MSIKQKKTLLDNCSILSLIITNSIMRSTFHIYAPTWWLGGVTVWTLGLTILEVVDSTPGRVAITWLLHTWTVCGQTNHLAI